MFCCISHQIPQEPVVSKENGHLFERRLIEAYVQEHGRCPVTGTPMTLDSLLPVHASPASTNLSVRGGMGATSIPGLLERLHAEWDGMMLEQFTLRQRVTQMQQELAHALQQYEAACAVIANLQQECSELRQRQGGGDGVAGDDGMNSIPAEVAAVIEQEDKQARAERKKRGKEKIHLHQQLTLHQQFSVDGEGTLQGVCLGKRTAYTAGSASKFAVLPYDMEAQKVVVESAGRGHAALVHSLSLSKQEDLLVSSSNDQTMRVWRTAEGKDGSASLTCARTIRFTNGVVAQSTRLISNEYILSSSLDGRVSLTNLPHGVPVVTTGPTSASSITAVELHPYTSLAAVTTSDGVLSILDVRQMVEDTTARYEGAKLQQVSFSADCVTLATGVSDGRVLLWDLRQLEKPVGSVEVTAEHSAAPAFALFDPHHSQNLLVAAGHQLRLFDSSKLTTEATNTNNTTTAAAVLCSVPIEEGHSISGACWSGEGDQFAVSSLNGVVRLYKAA